MNRPFRRLRLAISLLMLGVSPGVLGAWFHLHCCCPTPAVVEHGSDHAGGHEHGSTDQGQSDHHPVCVAVCHPAVLPGTGFAALPSVAVAAETSGPSLGAAPVRVLRIPYILPFALAPPPLG